MKQNTISELIMDKLKNHQVVLFMKGTAEKPLCGFSNTVVQILSHLNVKFEDVNVLDSDELRQAIKDFSQWPTIPQLYINNEFIGGCDIVKEMYSNGELIALLHQKSIPTSLKQ